MRKTIDLIREGKMQPIINTGDKLWFLKINMYS
jgi:hypothetical protein